MQPDHFRVVLQNQFPFPIASAFRRALHEKESREAHCRLLAAMLEYFGSVLVCDYLAQERRDPGLDAELRRLLTSPPTAGVWQEWIDRILRHFESARRSPLLAALTALRERSARRDLVQLIEWRNRWIHGGARFHLGRFRERLFGLLARVMPIHQCALFCPRSRRASGEFHLLQARLLMGDNPVFGDIECRADIPLETERVHLHGRPSGELLSLHPLICCARCDDCSDHHYFHYNRVGRRKLIYTSLPEGHSRTSSEAFALLEKMLVRAPAMRLRPRHFSIPGAFGDLPRTLQAGDRVGPYRVEALIEIGGMAQIYRVKDTRTSAVHALKLLPAELSRDPVLLMRFEEEAEHLKRLDHPNVIRFHDLGESYGDRYLVLDLARGGPIGSQHCRDLKEVRKPLREEDIVSTAKQICEGLQYIHSKGILHRDLKPGNVLLMGRRVLITDFGISRAGEERRLTLTGMPVGTPAYMAPEQIRGEEVDGRADIYSLGCILYELATGRPPYRASTPLTTTLYHLQAQAPRIEDLNPKISRGLANIIYKAIQKRPALRYQTARDLFHDLSRIDEDPAGPQVVEGEKTPQDALEELRARERRRSRRLVVRSAACLVLLVVLGFVGRRAYIEWKVREWVGAARALWRDGAEPTRVCDALRRAARLAGRDHRVVREFLESAISTGWLTVCAEPFSGSLQVVPDGEEDGRIGWGLHPEILRGDSRFLPGERIPLAPGHYRARLEPDDRGPGIGFPVFVGHATYRYAAGVWKCGHLRPGAEIALDPDGEDDPNGFTLAEQEEIRILLPENIPEGFVFVNPGPFWRAKTNLGAGERFFRDQGRKVWTHWQFELTRGSLGHGFLIAKDETTVEEFEGWMARLGQACLEWLAGIHAGIPAIQSDTEMVPLAVHRESWREALAGRGIDVDDLGSEEEILDEALRRYREFWESQYRDLRAHFEKIFADEKEKSRPMVLVDRNVALAYARTWAPIVPRAFRAWARRRMDEAKGLSSRLEELASTLEGAPGGFVDPRSLPGEPLLGRPLWIGDSFRRRTILGTYTWWLRRSACYAYQIPRERLLEWADEHRDGLRPEIRSRLREIEEALRIPSLWLWDRDPAGGAYSVKRPCPYSLLLGQYAASLDRGEERPEKEHFVLWLRGRARRAEARAGLYEEASAFRGKPDPVPWEVRLEYGGDRGWNLPTAAQWEKALRGADTRPYPWGYRRDDGKAKVGRSVDLWPSKVTDIGIEDADVSPYGVRGMAGNVSEWLLSDPDIYHHFLKGGNYKYESSFADAAHLFEVEGGTRLDWAGFRVIREIRPRSQERAGRSGHGKRRGTRIHADRETGQ